MGDGAEGELPGQTGASALGEQRGETQEHLLQVIVYLLLLGGGVGVPLFLRAPSPAKACQRSHARALVPPGGRRSVLQRCALPSESFSVFQSAKFAQDRWWLQGSGEENGHHGCSGKPLLLP